MAVTEASPGPWDADHAREQVAADMARYEALVDDWIALRSANDRLEAENDLLRAEVADLRSWQRIVDAAHQAVRVTRPV